MMHRRASRVLIALALFSLAAGRAEAQQFGVKGGVNVTDIAWGDELVLETPWAWGAVGGMFLRFQPAKMLSLQAEALISQLVIDFSAEGADVKNTLTNLQVPVLVSYTIRSGSSVRVRALGGGAMDIVLWARENVSGTINNIRDAVSPWSASLVAAADVEWGRWVLDGRYIFGLTNIYQTFEDELGFPSLTAKQRTIQGTVGWRF
jgi:hypothetical protein